MVKNEAQLRLKLGLPKLCQDLVRGKFCTYFVGTICEQIPGVGVFKADICSDRFRVVCLDNAYPRSEDARLLIVDIPLRSTVPLV
jgi:hypothetical protein